MLEQHVGRGDTGDDGEVRVPSKVPSGENAGLGSSELGARVQTYSAGTLRAYSGNNNTMGGGPSAESLALELGDAVKDRLPATARSDSTAGGPGRADLNQARFGRIHFQTNLRTCPFVVVAPDQDAHELLDMVGCCGSEL